MKYINSKNIYDYAFLNEDKLKYPIKAVCVEFHGYTDATMFKKSPSHAEFLGENGIAWVFPYYSVWAWMSKSSQEFNEQVIDAVYEKLGIDDKIPLIISGGSMGGLTALNYLIYGKRKAVGCALNCPVTDFCRIFEDRTDFRRAIVSAHICEPEPLEDIIKRYSPYHFADKLPKIPYMLIFGENDTYFTNILRPAFIDRLDELKIKYTSLVQENMNHCDLDGHPEAKNLFYSFIKNLIL